MDDLDLDISEFRPELMLPNRYEVWLNDIWKRIQQLKPYKRKETIEEFGCENVVVLLGAAEGEAAGLAAETVTAGDPTYAGPLTGVQLGLQVYHACEAQVKDEFDSGVYDEQIGMMEMVLDVDDIVNEMATIREQYCKY